MFCTNVTYAETGYKRGTYALTYSPRRRLIFPEGKGEGND